MIELKTYRTVRVFAAAWRICFPVLLVWSPADLLAAPPDSPKPTPTAVAVAASPAAPATVPLGEIASRSQTDLTALAAIESAGKADATIDAIRESLPELSQRVGLLLAEESQPTFSLDVLRDRALTWDKIADTLDKQAGLLFTRSQSFGLSDAQIKQAQALWTTTEKSAGAADAPPDTLRSVAMVLEAADAATQRVRENRNAMLELQAQLGDLQEKVRQAQAGVRAAQTSAVHALNERDSPPLWSRDAQMSTAASTENVEMIARQRTASIQFVQKNGTLFALHGLLVLALTGSFIGLRRVIHRWTEKEPHLQESLHIFDVPFAAALALSFLIKGAIYAEAPSLLRGLLGAVIILPTIVILRRLLERRLYRIPNLLFIFYFLDQVQVATVVFPRLDRLIFTFEMGGATAAFLWLALSARSFLTESSREESEANRERKAAAVWLQPLFWLAAVVCLAALVAGTLGYMHLGGLLGGAALRSGYVGVIFYALFSILRGLVAVVLRAHPASRLHIVQEHRAAMEARINRVLSLLTIGVWAWITIELFGLRAELQIGFGKVMDLPIGPALTIGHLIGFFVAIWVSVLVSRVIRFFLAEEVYQRVRLSPGLPYAISAMVNYGVLLVGFITALGLLQVDLTKVTIIVSAFSVGLGFGLQNVINNFVSGIILLFERPIRVGDIIQMGDASGEVRRIGIRASIIRLPDGADLIVPNGNLISNSVTNWTYSDRARAVEIALTVDADADASQRVLDLLKAVAADKTSDQTNVRTPQVFITGLVGGKLNITVRAWSSVYENSTLLRSDLASALFTALAEAKIKLI